ncbi:MAG: hypothetical protein ACP5DZ_04460 [Bacteroidales bacterium]
MRRIKIFSRVDSTQTESMIDIEPRDKIIEILLQTEFEREYYPEM